MFGALSLLLIATTNSFAFVLSSAAAPALSKASHNNPLVSNPSRKDREEEAAGSPVVEGSSVSQV
jgi:hypothetical protein